MKHQEELSVLQNKAVTIHCVCGMPGAEVRHPNEVSPGDFLSAADVEIVRNAARHRSVRKNVQIVRVTA